MRMCNLSAPESNQCCLDAYGSQETILNYSSWGCKSLQEITEKTLWQERLIKYHLNVCYSTCAEHAMNDSRYLSSLTPSPGRPTTPSASLIPCPWGGPGYQYKLSVKTHSHLNALPTKAFQIEPPVILSLGPAITETSGIAISVPVNVTKSPGRICSTKSFLRITSIVRGRQPGGICNEDNGWAFRSSCNIRSWCGIHCT